MKRKSSIKTIICVLMSCLMVSASAITVSASESIKADKESESFRLEGAPEISAGGAIAVDLATGYTMYEKDIYQKYYPASITKVMTAILSIENLKKEDLVTFSHDAVYTIEPGSSSGYLSEGEQITVEQCLYGLMLISGNDIANGLGEAVSGSMDAFAAAMTDKAKALGCVNTNFKNAHGLHDENHYTCPYDMAVMAGYAYQNLDFFRELIKTIRYEVPPTAMCNETRYWLNSNRMIRQGEEYYDDDCLGGKTGFTNEAGGTLVSFHQICGRTIMIVMMKDINSVGAYIDTKLLCDYISENTDTAYYTRLDKAYSELKDKEKESEAQSVNTGAAAKDRDKNNSSKNDGDEGSTFPLPVRILLVLIVVFVIYYFYISVQRNKKRKHKRKYYRDIKRREN